LKIQAQFVAISNLNFEQGTCFLGSFLGTIGVVFELWVMVLVIKILVQHFEN
jgi:hypothetical protein